MDRDTDARENYWTRRRLNRRRLVQAGGAAALGAGALVVAGCGDDEEKPPATTTGAAGGSQPTPGGATSTVAPGSSGAHAAPQGTLRASVASLQDQSSDPFFQTGGLAQPVQTSAFEGFYRGGDDGQPGWALAEALEIGPDRQTFVFKFRQGVKFWDGTDVTVNDAVWSFQAYVGRTPPNPASVLVKTQVESVTAPDASHVVVKLKKPNAFQGRDIGWWNIGSQAYHDKVGEDAWRQKSMCTGPFQIINNPVGQHMELQANELYWEKSRVPYVKTLRLNLVPELTTRIAQIKTGEADIIEGISGATAQSLTGQSGIKLVPSPQTAYLKINFFETQTGKAPWTDKRLREALVISVDQDAIRQGLLKQGTPCPNVMLFPKSLGYDASIFKVRPQDTARAKSLIQEAGLQGFTFNFYSYESSSYPQIPQVVQAIAGYWKGIGLDPQIQQLESGSYFTKFTNRKLDGAGAQGWPFSAYATAPLVVQLYMKTGSPYGNTDNDPTIDDYATKIENEADPTKQMALAQQCHKYAYEQFFFGSAPYSDSQWATTDKVTAWIRPVGDPYTTRLNSVQLKG